MQTTMGVVGVENVTVTVYMTEQEEQRVQELPDGAQDRARFNIGRKRVVADGAAETRFFPAT